MSEPEPEASPEQQEAVRRLLAEARHDAPVPPEVAARLDAVLDQLAAEGERAIDPPVPPAREAAVHDLAAARRRRRATGLLGAAAAVVVLGVGISRVDLPTSGSDSEATSGSAESADLGTDSKVESGSSGGSAEAPAEEGAFAPPSDVPVIGPEGFKRAVEQLRDREMVRANGASALDADLLTTESMFVCEPTTFGPGRLLAVLYDDAPAVLAYRPPTGTTQSVELLQCGTGVGLRSVVIPYP